MPFDPVPFFVGGGAVHSPEVARTLAYAATNGAQGIVTPGDLKVSATAVPGATVQVAPGAVIVVNRAAAQTNQSYVARVSTADSVAISPTNSSGGRTDLIVAQIEDPWLSGEPWQDPADPTVGPYVFTRVIPNVPANTTNLQDVSGYQGRTAVTLARVTIPANTATITNAMITDLRKVARPRKDRQLNAHAQVQAETQRLTSAAGQIFPSTTSGWTVDIPTWATRMLVIGTWSQVQAAADANGTAYGRLWVQIGADNDASKRTTQESSWDTVDIKTGVARYTYTVADSIAIPAGLRGRRVPATLRARRSADTVSGESLVLDAVSGVALDVEFVEIAE